MKNNILNCQVCLTKFQWISDFKKHLRSISHREKVADVFQTDIYKNHGSCPNVILMAPVARQDSKQTIVGLSLLTFCFSQEPSNIFYLCHVCEEKCSSERIVAHLCSGDHCSNYITYMDPDVLTFSWLPSMNTKVIYRDQLKKELNNKGPGALQMLELPRNLLKKLETSTYAEVMHTFSENDKLLKLIKASVEPDRKNIQTYQRDNNRKHPLLGMQHLVECICVGPTEKRHYLCTLCNLTLASRTIIHHVLSFDHIFCYFRAYHPSTLMSRECYKDYNISTASTIIDYAKQTLEIHGTADVKQVSLEPDVFTSVNFACYAEALKKLESIRKENKESSLITSITPGKMLVCSQPCKTQSGNFKASATVSASSAAVSYKLRCQDCSKIFATIAAFVHHMSQMAHKQMVQKSFGIDKSARDHDQTGQTPFLALYSYIKERSKQNQPAIGVPLVVTCISTQRKVETMHVCFACEDCFHESHLRQHFGSRKHLIHTLLYQNPWRLPFAWDNYQDIEVLKSMAWEEEKERGPNQMIMKVLDIPYKMLCGLKPSYPEVMKTLQLQHSLLKREVPRCETYSKLQENERFPLLGERFLVMFDVCVQQHQSTEVGFLCLLCERRLSDKECYAHVFSREHVASFLDHFHPDSLNSSTDAETLVDLAKQAARIHPRSHVKVIKLERPIWEPCSYQQAKVILEAAGKKSLKPQIEPKMKLVPRAILKTEHNGHARDNCQQNSQMTEVPEKMTSQTSTDNVEKTVKKEIGAEFTNTHCVTSGEKGANNCKENKRQRSSSMSEDTEEMGHCHKRQQLTSVQDASFEELQNQPSSKQKEGSATDEAESGKTSHKAAKDKASSNVNPQQAERLWQYVKRESREPVVGLDVLLECYCDQHDPFYLCEGCSLMIPESDIISHVTGADHQKKYLMKHLPPPAKHLEKNTRSVAALFEQVNGNGEALVVDLDEETYNSVSKQNFESAIQTVKALQSPWCELPSTSALSAVQPMDTSVTLHAQHGVSPVMDDFQLSKVKIESDDSGDSEGKPSLVTAAVSVKTQTTSKATESKDAKMTQIKVSQSAENANTRPTVSRSHEDASSLLVSTSGSNTTCLASDSTGNNLKAEIFSNTVVATLKIATASQYAAASDSAVTTSTKSMTAGSKGPIKSSNCTSATTKTAAPISSHRATTSISNTPTTSKLRNWTAPTSSSTEATKQTAATPTSSTFSKMENGSKKSETTVQIKCDNAKASAKTVLRQNSGGLNADVAPNVQKSKSAATPHLTIEKNNPPTKPSHVYASKRMPSESRDVVGVDQLIKVSCEGRRGVYCQMCSVRLDGSNHLTSSSHQYNYVKLKYPGTANISLSQVANMVSYLAEADRVIGAQVQGLEVTMNVYEELANLPVNIAIERLKAMLRERDSQVSFSTTDRADVLRLQAANSSPCEASTPHDEIGSISKEEGNLAASQSDRAQSLKSSEPEADDLTSDQLHLCTTLIKEEPEPETISGVRDEYFTVHVKQKAFQSDVVSQPTVEVTPAIERPVKVEKTQRCADLLATDSESVGRFAQTPDMSQDTSEKRHQQKRSDPESQDTQKEPGRIQKTSPVTFCPPHLFPSAVSVNAEQQNQSRPSQSAEHHSAPQALPVISVGSTVESRSHLSMYLKVQKVDKPVIGLGSVWECRKMLGNTFFLCESCEKTLSLSDISRHVVSVEHSFNYVEKQWPHFLKPFWALDDMPLDHKLEILQKIIASKLSEREQDVDAQVILLTDVWYERVRTAPFIEALKIVHSVRKPTQNLYFRSVSQPKDQQPEERQSQQESHPTEKPSTQALMTDQRSENAGQSAEKHNLKETAMVGDLDGVKQRRVLSPLDVAGVSSKTDSVVSPIPGAGTCHSPQESYRSLYLHTELRPPVSQHQSPNPKLELKQEEHPESPSSFSVSPKTSQAMSPRDECPPPRKRPAVETLVSSNLQLEGPLPAKHAHITPQPDSHPSTELASESMPVCPAGTFTHPFSEDNESNEGDASIAELVALVRERRAERDMSPFKSAPNNAESTTPCAGNSPENGVGKTWYPQYAQTSSDMVKNQTAWDSNEQLVEAKPSIVSLEGMLSTAAPVVVGSGQQFMGGYNRQVHTPVSSVSAVATASPSNTQAAVDGQHRQMAHVTNEQQFPAYLSSQAFAGSPMPDNPAVYTGGLYQQREGHTPGVFYPSQVYPQQEANCFWHIQTPVGRVKLEQQGLLLTNAAPAAGTVPSIAPANSSQMFINLNSYGTNTITPTPNSNNTQNNPQVYLTTPVVYYPPTVHNPQ